MARRCGPLSANMNDGLDQGAASAAVARLARIEWRADPVRRGSQVALFREFLRRSAIAAEKLDAVRNWPMDDLVRAALGPCERLPAYVFLDQDVEYPGPASDPLEAQAIALNVLMNEFPGAQGPHGRNACWWYLRWEAAHAFPALRAIGVPNPYEPLIAFFERGGQFRSEQGYWDLRSVNISKTSATAAAGFASLASLASADLDALDVPTPPAIARRPDARKTWIAGPESFRAFAPQPTQNFWQLAQGGDNEAAYASLRRQPPAIVHVQSGRVLGRHEMASADCLFVTAWDTYSASVIGRTYQALQGSSPQRPIALVFFEDGLEEVRARAASAWYFDRAYVLDSSSPDLLRDLIARVPFRATYGADGLLAGLAEGLSGSGDKG